MSTVTEITETVQDGVLRAMATSQRLTTETLEAVASTVEGLFPAPTLPFGAAFGTPKEAIGSTLRFAERVLESQKSFLSELATIGSSTRPATPKRPVG